MVSLTGCGYEKSDNILGNNFIVKEVVSEDSNYEDVYIVVDKRSGINYYWITSRQGRSLTPIYDKEGKFVIDKVEQD